MPSTKKKRILIINICKEKLHYFEFVKPIERILENLKIRFYTKYYTKFTDKDLKAEKVIICGTSLADKDYLENIYQSASTKCLPFLYIINAYFFIMLLLYYY